VILFAGDPSPLSQSTRTFTEFAFDVARFEATCHKKEPGASACADAPLPHPFFRDSYRSSLFACREALTDGDVPRIFYEPLLKSVCGPLIDNVPHKKYVLNVSAFTPDGCGIWGFSPAPSRFVPLA